MTPWVFQGPLTSLNDNMSIREALNDSERSREIALSLWCPILMASIERMLLSLEKHMTDVNTGEVCSVNALHIQKCLLCRCPTETNVSAAINRVPCRECEMALSSLVMIWHDSVSNHLASPPLLSTSYMQGFPRPSTHVSLLSLRDFLTVSCTDREMIITRIIRERVLTEGILQNDLQRSVQLANMVYRRSVCPNSDATFKNNMSFITKYLLTFPFITAVEPNPIAMLEVNQCVSESYSEALFVSNIVIEKVNEHLISSPFDTSLATALVHCLAGLAQRAILGWISKLIKKCHTSAAPTRLKLEASEILGEIIHYYVRSEIDVICGWRYDTQTDGHIFNLPSTNFDCLASDIVSSLFAFVATGVIQSDLTSCYTGLSPDHPAGRIYVPCSVADLENQQEVQASIPGQAVKYTDAVKHIRVLTGCDCIDSIVGGVCNGGFPLGQLSEVYGEAGSGKTQIGIATLVHTVAQGVILSDICSENDHCQKTNSVSSVSAIYFVAEDLPQSRLKELAIGAALELLKESDHKVSVDAVSTIILQNIFIRKIIDLEHFIGILRDSSGTGLVRFIEEKNVKVIVVDSIAAAVQSTVSNLSNPKRHRGDHNNDRENGTNTNSLSLLIGELGSLLASIAACCFLAVVVLNQVRAVITTESRYALSGVSGTNRSVVGDCRTGWTLDQPYMLAEEYMKTFIAMCTRSGSCNSSHALSTIPSLYTPALGLRWAQFIQSRFCVVKSQTMVDVGRIISGSTGINKQSAYQPLRIIQGVFSPLKDVTGGALIHTIRSTGTFVVQTDCLRDMTASFC